MSLELPRCPLSIDAPATEWRAWLAKLTKLERADVVSRIADYLHQGRYDKWAGILSVAYSLDEAVPNYCAEVFSP